MERPLSELLKLWRAERPDEWTMDEFIREAKRMEKQLQNTAHNSDYIKKPSALEYRRICTKEKINPIVADLIYHLFFI